MFPRRPLNHTPKEHPYSLSVTLCARYSCSAQLVKVGDTGELCPVSAWRYLLTRPHTENNYYWKVKLLQCPSLLQKHQEKILKPSVAYLFCNS